MNLEQLLLARVAEEASEIAQEAIKCIRFTTEHKLNGRVSNLDRLLTEKADLEGLFVLLNEIGVLKEDFNENKQRVNARIVKELAYLTISQEMGVIKDLSLLNKCSECVYAKENSDEGYCYMFREKPLTICQQFKR